MPHVPRRYPTTTGMPPESMVPPRASHPNMPVRGDVGQQADETQPKKLNIGMQKLSLHDYEPNIDQIVEIMFGKKPETDSHTQQLRPGK